MDSNDHVKNWTQSNKGKQLGLYVTTTPGLSEDELALTFDLWQTNMINCCQFELTFMPLEGDKMLVLLPDGKWFLDFATMLRNDKKCFTFHYEQTTFLCPGHPRK